MEHSENFSINVNMKIIDCLICGNEQFCFRFHDHDKETYYTEVDDFIPKWAYVFCNLFNMGGIMEMCNIISSGYYCNYCMEDLKTVARISNQIEKLQVELHLKKVACEFKMRNANAKGSRSNRNNYNENETQVNDNAISQLAEREKLYNYLDSNQLQQTVSFQDSALLTDSDGKREKFYIPPLNSIMSPGPDPDADGEFLSASLIVKEEDIDHSDSVDTIHNEAKTNLLSPTYENNDTDQMDYLELSFEASKTILAVPHSSNKMLYDDNDSDDPSYEGTNNTFSHLTEIDTSGSDSKNSSSRGILSESSDDSSEFGEQDDDGKDPDFSIHEAMFGYRRIPKPPKSKPKPKYLPTIFSDRMDESTALREKYKTLVQEYGLKHCMIPLGRIPDLDSLDSDDESMDHNHKGLCPCPIVDCTTVCYKKHRLIEHIRTVHQGKQFPYECWICRRKFSRRNRFKDHLNTHSGETPYVCEHCDRKFPVRVHLRQHILFWHTEKKFKCDHCSKCFSTKRSCAQHTIFHSNARPFMCEICGKGFKNKYVLSNHQTLHPELNLVPFKCDVCSKVLGTEGSLKLHVKSHTGDLPFQCDICDYKASCESKIRTHKFKHWTGPECECDVCHVKFKNPNVLNRHKKYWCRGLETSTEFDCTECGKKFRNSILLRLHRKIHMKRERTFLCSECGKGYFTKKHLQRHTTQAHKIESKTGHVSEGDC